MTESTMKSTVPLPRDGLIGEWDRFVGPGASRWENAGTLGLAAVGAAAAPALIKRQRPDAAPLELAAQRKRSLAGGLYTVWLAGTSIAARPPSGYAGLPSVLGFKLLLGHGTPRGPLSALRRRRRSPDG